jgi:hypothetical protein
MVTFLITSFLILAFLVVVVYFWQKPNAPVESPLLPAPPEPRGLFSSEQAADPRQLGADELAQRRAAVLERANNGDKSALKDAQLENDPSFYNAALDSLTDRATSDPQLLSLISYVTRAELPVNAKLAQAVFRAWWRAPDRSSTAKTLHIIALSDDASLYNEAVETALHFCREGQLPDVSSEELRALMDGEFWILSSKVRSSGAGFLLKRTLARARRELSAQAHVNQ